MDGGAYVPIYAVIDGAPTGYRLGIFVDAMCCGCSLSQGLEAVVEWRKATEVVEQKNNPDSGWSITSAWQVGSGQVGR